MDSKLDSIFRTTFQPAQQTDTRQGIKRDDHQEQGRKDSGYRHKDDDEFGEDQATLSVQALHEFLKNLLMQAGEKMPAAIAQIMPDEDEMDGAHPAPQDRAAAHAARAYQTTARAAPGQSIDFSERPAAASQTPQGPAITLSAEELRVIHKLIEDIEALGQRGIAAIPLIAADNFLESLILGVEAASG